MQAYNLERAQRYWRFVPSGEGKHNTEQLARLSDAELKQVWDRAFDSRFMRYPEEDCFMQVMAESFRGKKILSIGSGMGFHELYYQSRGADVTCCDIVETNLEIIHRMAAIKGLPAVKTIATEDTTRETFGGPYDVCFVYGSLMAMPAEQQRSLLARLKASLKRDGQIVLMLYTWKFAESTCGWNSREDFDPLVFARASDPSVGAEHCPWSDWHDDAKLLELAGAGMHITRKQLWQQGLFVWYTLEFGRSQEEPKEYFDRDALGAGQITMELPLSAFQPVGSIVSRQADGALRVDTGSAPFTYALVSPPCTPAQAGSQPNALVADITVLEGGVSAGVLDIAAQKFVNTAILIEPGRHMMLLPLPGNLPSHKIILSNHSVKGPCSSSFLVHAVRLVRRDSVVGF